MKSLRGRLVIAAVALAGACAAQNLVPNGSFEEYTECPDNVAQATRATGWEQNTLTPDYFNACSDEPEVDVPYNNFGVMEAFDGSAYVGMIAFSDSFLVPVSENFRERLGRYLSTPLVAGVETYVSFRVGIAAFGPQPVQVKWTCKGLGAKFMMGPMDLWSPAPAPTNDAHVYLTQVPIQPQTWYLVADVFVPDSAYAYVVLGNFFSDSLSSPYMIDSDGTYGVAYMYIDNVCVSPEPDFCEQALGTQGGGASQPIVAPNPCVDLFTLHFGWPTNHALQLLLSDHTGRVLEHFDVPIGSTRLVVDGGSLGNGIYWISSANRTSGFGSVPIVKIDP